MKKHSKFSASKSHIWLNCPGSVSLSEKAPPDKPSVYAEEGTLAHECLENFLKGRDSRTRKYPNEMVEHVYVAVNHIGRVKQELRGAEILIEEKVDLGFIHPEMFGTLDVALVSLFDRLHIIDYKHGQGFAVDPRENTQLIFYALGVAHKYDYNFEDISLTIVQPRADHEDGPVRSWILSVKELKAWRKVFEVGVSLAEKKDPKLEPGDHCRWCNAKPICPAISSQALKQAQIVFSDKKEISFPDPKELRPEVLSKTLKALELIEVWSKAVRYYSFSILERGEKIEGFKLVQKRSTRKWIDEEKLTPQAVKKFGPKVLQAPKLLSPAQMEKICDSSKWIAEHVSNESSGLTMVEAGDPRPAFNSIENAFSGK